MSANIVYAILVTSLATFLSRFLGAVSSEGIKETSKLISDAINDKKWIKKSQKTEISYDNNLDEIAYDTNLEDVYKKIYIKDQYIFKDDTIKIIRNKISVSLPINDKFGKDNKLLPEYQYFWSEYNINNKIDRVMIGQKWIRRNELLNIDIRPNTNLKVYENLRNNLGYLKESFGYKIKREDDAFEGRSSSTSCWLRVRQQNEIGKPELDWKHTRWSSTRIELRIAFGRGKDIEFGGTGKGP